MSARPTTPAAATQPGAPAANGRRRATARQILLLALVPLLAILWWPLLRGSNAAPSPAVATPPSATPPPPTAAEPSTAATSAGAPAAALPTTTLAEFAARVRALSAPFQSRWSPLPHRASMPAAAPIGESQPAAADRALDPRLVPTSILTSRNANPVAIIQGRACRAGDVVAEHTIFAIEPTAVVYRFGTHSLTVPLPTPTLGAAR